MKFDELMASAAGVAAMLIVATAPAALAKGKPGNPTAELFRGMPDAGYRLTG